MIIHCYFDVLMMKVIHVQFVGTAEKKIRIEIHDGCQVSAFFSPTDSYLFGINSTLVLLGKHSVLRASVAV